MGRGSGNSRNGSTPKTVTTEIGEVELLVPGDRAGTFEPVTVPKHRRRLEGLSGNVISLYAKGLTTGEIQAHLAEIYDTSVSRETISKITEGIVADMAAWQNRTARPGPCGAGFDAIVVKVRDSQVANRPVYVAIGVDLAGERDVLGMWLGPSGGEGAKQWATMPAELRNRGLADASVRVLRRPQGLALLDPGDLARSDGADLRGAHGPREPAVRVAQALGPDHQGHARHLCTSSTVEAAETRFAQFADDWEDTLPRHDRVMAELLGRVRAVRGVPARAAQSRPAPPTP